MGLGAQKALASPLHGRGQSPLALLDTPREVYVKGGAVAGWIQLLAAASKSTGGETVQGLDRGLGYLVLALSFPILDWWDSTQPT